MTDYLKHAPKSQLVGGQPIYVMTEEQLLKFAVDIRSDELDEISEGRWYKAEDIDRMVKEIAVALDGEKAATNPKLCDIYHSIIQSIQQHKTASEINMNMISVMSWAQESLEKARTWCGWDTFNLTNENFGEYITNTVRGARKLGRQEAIAGIVNKLHDDFEKAAEPKVLGK